MNRRRFLGVSSGLFGMALGAQTEPPPNVVLIYADDLGYGDLGCYGSKIRTPNLDRMAAEGARFTNFYSASPVCSPSRAALLTGKYPTRVGVPRVLFPQDQEGLPATEKTLAEILKQRNYATMCIGKWHLGRPVPYLPTSRGFDRYFGIPYSNDMTPCPLMRDTEIIQEPASQAQLTPRYTEEAVQFIEKSAGSPFFLYMPHTFPHIPLAASERFRGKSKQGIYGDVVEELDWSVGEVLNALKSRGVDRRTIVLFSSDNGPWFEGSPGRLRGRKGSTYEGGVRVPFIARYPGKIPAGSVSHAVTSTMDMAPTLSKLCGVRAPEGLDGIDIWAVLSGQSKTLDREALLYFDGWNAQCARMGDWKLHFARYNSFSYSPAPPGGRVNLPLRPELYNLADDPDESYDVAAENPAVVKDMLARVERLIEGFPAEVREAYAATNKRAVRERPAAALPIPESN